MIILNELILKLNEKWYDRCRTGKEAIYEYRVFKIFCRAGKLQHYGKAAKALNISQPGLSHAIKTLEDEYGVPLFQKEGRNVSLSRYGKELMQDVEEILDAYLRMEERAAASDGRKDSADRNRISARGRNNTTYAAGIRRDLPVYHLQPPDPRDRGGSAGWKIRYRLLLRTAEIRRTRILSPPGILHRGRRPGRSSAGGEREHHTKRSSQVSAGHVFQDERLPQPPRADLRRTGHPGKTRV